MTIEEFKILTSDRAMELLEENLGEDPASFALSLKGSDLPVAALATQLQHLNKSRSKIPSYFEARCILPSRAFEQCSGERAAALKPFTGGTCLDLNFGLGVDSVRFSRSFQSVRAVEISSLLVAVGRHNLRKLGISNVEIIEGAAETVLRTWDGPPFDLIYLDPDRRDARGARKVVLEACQPNVLEIMSLLLKKGTCILIKLSPLFDLEEAVRLFPHLHALTVISIDNECKEVLVALRPSVGNQPPALHLLLDRKGAYHAWSLPRFPADDAMPGAGMDIKGAAYLAELDVAFYKARCAATYFQRLEAAPVGIMNHPEGYFFSSSPLEPSFPGRQFKVIASMPYKPKKLKAWLKRHGIQQLNIMRRHFRWPVKEVRRQLGIREGGPYMLVCSMQESQGWAWIARPWHA